jgi:hypothetical protein
MDDDGDDDGNGGSDHTSDESSDSEDMEDDEDVEDDGESDGNSIIDMLEEQQMEADQVDGAEAWTTDTDSAEEGEEMDEEESNDDEFGGGFPHPPIPVLDEDELDYSEEDLDDGADVDEVRQMMNNLEGEIFDPMPDEDDDDEDMHQHDGWILPGRANAIRHGGIHQYSHR